MTVGWRQQQQQQQHRGHQYLGHLEAPCRLYLAQQGVCTCVVCSLHGGSANTGCEVHAFGTPVRLTFTFST